MNDAELAAITAELSERLVGRALTGAWQPARDRIYLGFGELTLLIVPRGPFARLHLVSARPRNLPRPFSFQGALRAHLLAPVDRIEKDGSDRVVVLTLGPKALHLRLTGRSGGLWLVGPEGPIAGYDGPTGALPALTPSPARHPTPRFSPGPEGWNRTAEAWFERREEDHRRESRRANVLRALQRRLAHVQRLWEALQADLVRAEEAPALRRRADALAAALHRVPRGAARAEVVDLEDGETTFVVELDPKLSASANLDRLYKRAGRLDRAADRVLAHHYEVEADLRVLREALAAAPDADEPTLDGLSRLAPPQPAPRAASERTPWQVWTGPHGERVLVGRDAASNNQLTFRVARGDDFWMHVRERPGAHVVLPMRRGQAAPLDHLLAAAQIALLASKVPEGTACDVTYARARHVRAVPGAPGRVTLNDERVLHVTRDRVPRGWTREDDG